MPRKGTFSSTSETPSVFGVSHDGGMVLEHHKGAAAETRSPSKDLAALPYPQIASDSAFQHSSPSV